MDFILNGERMKQAECFRYLGADIYETGRMNEEINQRVGEEERIAAALEGSAMR